MPACSTPLLPAVSFVTPAKAGIQGAAWTPAFAGVTEYCWHDPCVAGAVMEPISTASAAPATPAKPGGAGEAHLWEKGDFSFGDILDAINPLQHLPVISTLYRAITGDEIGTAPRLIGDLLFGGPIGFMTGVISVGIKDQTGKDPGEQVLAMLEAPFASDASAAPMVAAAPPAAPETQLAENAKASPAPVSEPPATTPAGKLGVDVMLEDTFTSDAASAPVAAAAPSAAPETQLAANAKASPEPVSEPPATPARKLGVDVKPDHPPMPLIRSGGAIAAPQTAVVPLQTATIVPRPPTFAAPASTVDVPRKMMDALDKYARMQAVRGAQVDLAN